MIDARTLADIRVNVAIQAELIRIQGMLAAIIDQPDLDTQDNQDT